MSATPEALQITKIDPPVPAQYAMSCHNWSSVAYWSREYMPMVAATSGTLSTTAEAKPITAAMTSKFPMESESCTAKVLRSPLDSRAPTFTEGYENEGK